jgi:hypothetical protein
MQKAVRFITILFLAVSALSLLLIPLANVARGEEDPTATADETTAAPDEGRAAGPSPSPTLCPQATPEPLWVDPVQSPTGAFTQTIVVYIGNGEYAEVVMETGTYTQTGDFGAFNNPAEIEVVLASGEEHHLTVSGRVESTQVNGCPYGGYTLSTTIDRDGNPLTIVQTGGEQEFLPIIEK